jgi:hypothetical protein
LAINELADAFGRQKQGSFEAALTGAVAGVISQTVCYPLDFLRTRMIVYPDRYRSLWHATWKVTNEEGFLALWTGLVPTIAGSIPYEGSQLVVYEKLRQMYGRRKVTRWVNAGFGIAAGIVSQSVSYPFETVRKLMMLTDDKGSKIYKSMGECFASVYEKDGVVGFFRGLGLNTLKVIPFSALQYTLYEETCAAILWLRKKRYI